ncbi:hypothetical protein PoB_005678400 [Plakobranchus ocellatus]|uniref:Uncharacterized protein n=1 Tax=Plakobranchus ocellatus TaxID=259542 RepID=A0AAV4CGI0_9GAST|nr:hypothetical protein PoB_005678400 [Plakobranchus ocellatus]
MIATAPREGARKRFCSTRRSSSGALLAENAVVNSKLPYLFGEVKALCSPDAIYDVIFGNSEGARGPEDPDMSVMVSAAMTSAQALSELAHPVRVPPVKRPGGVDRDQLISLQQKNSARQVLSIIYLQT